MTNDRRMVCLSLERALDDAFRFIEANRNCSKHEVRDILTRNYGNVVAWEWGTWADRNNIEDN